MDKNIELAFSHFSEIETERLQLRAVQDIDVMAIWNMRKNNRVNEFIGREPMASMESAEELVRKCHLLFKNKQGIAWAGVRKTTNEVIGTCGFNSIDFSNRHAEIGGEMSTDYWGKKLAYEAVSAIISFGFNELKLHTVEAKVMGNNRSALYLLNLLGFVKEAHFKDRLYFGGNYHDLLVCTLINPND
jgi:ribosomal-protein-alanine N-acetyltransferase